ncbi:fatty acid desaturase [Leptolyngbya sp. KIOST-1]|uniref:fatty acid desaturase n=1 Tax=Leptolyngbya sp. KIOST-1 TaxID=1229172 RepID=UPI0009DEAAC9|nr:fatty acid desaturase [Leptolyngbya sp. KIOST-1]
MFGLLPAPHFKSFSYSQWSLCCAGLIGLMWLVSLVATFAFFDAQIPLVFWLWAILIRTFLHTGLFIVAHEAIHRNISSLPGVNDAFGYVTSWLYALLPYRLLAKHHRFHHRFPATEYDPDYCDPGRSGFWSWYVKFMKTYQSGRQIWVSLAGFAIVFCGFLLCQIPLMNVILFWILPIVLSSLQLFTFGIFLPHRQADSGSSCGPPTRSINLPAFWSFITCYHFGYHREHHLNPHLPWYQLPQVYGNGEV